MFNHTDYRETRLIKMTSDADHAYYKYGRRRRISYEGEVIHIPSKKVLKDTGIGEFLAERSNGIEKAKYDLSKAIKKFLKW